MTQRWTVVGFTGHRKLADPSAAARGIGDALNRLAPGEGGALAAVSSAASGADTLFLEAAAQRHVPRHVILPFPEEHFEQDFSNEPEAWARVKPLIDAAGCVEVVGDADDRHQAYLEAGVWTVEQCDVLIAVWDRQPARGTGGTAQVVAFAEALGKRVLVVDPNTGAINDRPATDAPDPGAYVAHIERPPTTATLAEVNARYDRHSNLAMGHAPRARRLTLWIIFLHLFASAVAIVGLVCAGEVFADMEEKPKWPGYVFGGVKVGVLLLAVGLVLWHHRVQHTWIAHRPRAELIRSFQAMWRLRRSHALLPDTPLPLFQDLIRDLRVRWRYDGGAEVELEDAKRLYLNDRIRHQRDYFLSRGTSAAWWRKSGRRVAHVITAAAIVAGTVVLLLVLGKHLKWQVNKDVFHTTYVVLKAASVILPLAVAVVLSIVMTTDTGRRADRYAQMADRLTLHHRAVAAAPSWPALWRAVHSTEQELINELDEWRTVTHLAGESH